MPVPFTKSSSKQCCNTDCSLKMLGTRSCGVVLSVFLFSSLLMLFSLHSPTAFKVQLLELLQTGEAEEFEVVLELLALQCQNR